MPPSPVRRRKIDYAIGILLLVLGGLLFYPGLRLIGTEDLQPRRSASSVIIADEEDIPEGGALSFTLHGQPFILIHQEGRFFAVSGLCTYRNADLLWDGDRKVLVCTGHDCIFNRRGEVLGGVARSSLTTLSVRELNGRILAGKDLL